jgi:hypothetical protein
VVVEVLTGWGVVLGLQRGDYVLIECPDCDGIGLFQMPEDEYEPCTMCKSQGVLVR